MAKQGWDVPALRRIFTLDHPDFVCDPVVVKLDEDHYWINGSIRTRDQRAAGAFTRQLDRRNFEWIAVHDSFRVAPEFRRRRIAYSHYRKALRAYVEFGCDRVEMFAQEYGPFVWPQFGFRCRRTSDRDDIVRMLDRLHRDRTGRGIESVPDREFGIVAVESSSGEQIGALAAKNVATNHPNGALEMVLDLRDPVTIAYLVERGILSPEETL
jgi:hypothetical protein